MNIKKVTRVVILALGIMLLGATNAVVAPAANATGIPNEEVAKEVYQRAVGLGATKEVAAAVTANVWQESTFQPSVVNSIGAAGLFQWLNGRRTNMEASAASKGVEWTSVKHQVEFALRDEYAGGGDPFATADYGELGRGKFCDSSYNTTPCSSLRLPSIDGGISGYLKGKDLAGATVEWTLYWERPGEAEAHTQTRIEHAQTILDAFKDLKGLTPDDKEVNASGGDGEKKEKKSAGGGAVLSEWELRGMPDEVKWSGDVKIEEKSAKDLSSGENYAISKLSDDLENGSKHWADKINVFVAFVGLILMIWGMFLWMGALFDHVNNLVPIHLVRKLTFGKFEYTSDKEEAEVDGMISAKGIVIRGFGAIIIGLLLLSGVMMGFLIEVVYYLDGLTRTFMNKN